MRVILFFFFQAEDGIRDVAVTGVQTCALPISSDSALCTCDSDTEKFDGTACVASADFTAPTCESDDRPVCGCDGANYTSSRSEERRVGKECRSRWSTDE